MTISIDTALTARRAHWLAAPLLGRSSSSVSWRSVSGSQWGVCTSLCGLEGKIQDVALHSRGSDESLHCWGGTCITINFCVVQACLTTDLYKCGCETISCNSQPHGKKLRKEFGILGSELECCYPRCSSFILSLHPHMSCTQKIGAIATVKTSPAPQDSSVRPCKCQTSHCNEYSLQ